MFAFSKIQITVFVHTRINLKMKKENFANNNTYLPIFVLSSVLEFLLWWVKIVRLEGYYCILTMDRCSALAENNWTKIILGNKVFLKYESPNMLLL